MAMKRRVCSTPGCPTITDQRRCPEHRAQHERDRGTPAERGYGTEHKRLRRELEPDVAAGLATCWRCGQPLSSAAWHLGHDDVDRSVYRGPECPRCNTSAGGRAAHRG